MKSRIFDIHTHLLPAKPGTAFVSVTSQLDFTPHEGHLYAFGLHPWDVDEAWPEQVERMEALYRHAVHRDQLVMMGEMGLDRLRGADLALQSQALTAQLKMAESIGKIPIIHDVHSMAELLALRRELRCQLPWLVHGFRGGPEQMRQYLRAGCHLSLGSHFQAETLLALPDDELFLESDNDATALPLVYQRVSALLGQPVEAIRSQVSDNVCRLLGSEA